MVEPASVQARLVSLYGEGFEVWSGQGADGQILRVEIAELGRGHGFALEFVVGWRAVEARFVPGPFASEVIEAIRRSSMEQRILFARIASEALARGGDVRMSVGGVAVAPADPATWPTIGWEDVSVTLRKGGLLLDARDPERQAEDVIPWVARFTGMILALLPVESDGEALPAGEEEGTPIQVLVRRYERSRLNRAACVDHHGTACKACGLDFGDRYGPLGEGYIHVHHLEPLSTMDGSYVLDPLRDLVPLCPNCHSMAHRRTPPLTIEELKAMLRRS